MLTCAEKGGGRLIGFHPEGTRNKSEDPYSFLDAQPGIGRLILEARPQLVPVFIAGLSNSLGHELGQGRRERVPESGFISENWWITAHRLI